MTTQFIQKMMGTTAQETLTALFEVIARFGCGLAGLPYEQ